MQPDTSIQAHPQVQAVRQNDESELKALYQRNYAKVERYVLDNNGSEEEAKDVFQEAFIAVWRNVQLGKYQQQENSSLDAYLVRIAKNKWLDQLRINKRRPVVSLTEQVNGTAEEDGLPQIEQQALDSIKKNLGLLGQMCREVLARFYYRKESMREIAADMNWTEATARNNKYRCLQQLRKMVNSKNPDLE